MKPNRQAKILELIETKDIETQEQLLQELEACGFATTQATISGISRSFASSRSWGRTAATATAPCPSSSRATPRPSSTTSSASAWFPATMPRISS